MPSKSKSVWFVLMVMGSVVADVSSMIVIGIIEIAGYKGASMKCKLTQMALRYSIASYGNALKTN